MGGAVYLRPETIERIRAKMAGAGVAEDDLEETFVRGAGAGGQKINKTSSCVQLRHAPTNTLVRCQKSRSREANRWLAREMLAEKILAARRCALSEKEQEIERVRRQKRRRSRRQKARMLADKRRQSLKKQLRGPVRGDE